MQNEATQKISSLQRILVRMVERNEETQYTHLMQTHHYLGALPKIGETLWYVATLDETWIALLSFSSPALKCAARDQWIGWDFRHQYDRLHLVTNNSRCLILPHWHLPNFATRILSLCQKRLAADWQHKFHHPLLLLETFVDPSRFNGTIYKAANWRLTGYSKGFQRTREGYSKAQGTAKMVFVYPLARNARRLLSQPILQEDYQYGRTKQMIAVEQMRALPDFFTQIPDPRRGQGRRHRLDTVLSLAVAATLCGAKGYQGIFDWANALGQKARAHFRCRKLYQGQRLIPSVSSFRNVLIRIDPQALEQALQCWTHVHGEKDESLAIDGKTMRGAVNERGRQVHIMSAVGHHTQDCYAQKK